MTQPSTPDPIAAGSLIIASLLVGGAIGWAVGSLVGVAVLLALVGAFAGTVGGVGLVIARFRDP